MGGGGRGRVGGDGVGGRGWEPGRWRNVDGGREGMGMGGKMKGRRGAGLGVGGGGGSIE